MIFELVAGFIFLAELCLAGVVAYVGDLWLRYHGIDILAIFGWPARRVRKREFSRETGHYEYVTYLDADDPRNNRAA